MTYISALQAGATEVVPAMETAEMGTGMEPDLSVEGLCARVAMEASCC